MINNAYQVLIVDDLPVNRMILSSLLASRGVVSDQADSGKACLEMCRQKDYDLILLDHRMPEMDGIDTLTFLKDIFAEKEREIPVICHTVEEGRKNINLYKAAGFADVLIKPIDPRELSEMIVKYLPEMGDKKENTAIESIISEREEPVECDDAFVRQEMEHLPMWLKSVANLDLAAGIKGCGGAEDYIEALEIFHASIEDKAKDIERSAESGDVDNYRILVHSLKSMARLVGAKKLGELSTALEEAADGNFADIIRKDTPELLAEYREYIKLLEPVEDEEDAKHLAHCDSSKDSGHTHDFPEKDKSRTVLFIHSQHGVAVKGIEKGLAECGFFVIGIPERPDVIINHRFEADIILYYPSIDEDSHIDLTMNLLGEISQDDSKIFCLAGDPSDLQPAIDACGSAHVSRVYKRPIDLFKFTEDMVFFSELLRESRRRKNIYIVDDDKDYSAVIEKWLSSSYNVSCFSKATDMLKGLSTMVPDLIILDYEMPEINGYDLIKELRTIPEVKRVPIIFLTGKNDRDRVFSILQYKPDGYLLKSVTKDDLTDYIARFFRESFFRKSLKD